MNAKLPAWLPALVLGLLAGAFAGWALAAGTALPLSQSAGTGWGCLTGLLLTAAYLLLRRGPKPPAAS